MTGIHKLLVWEYKLYKHRQIKFTKQIELGLLRGKYKKITVPLQQYFKKMFYYRTPKWAKYIIINLTYQIPQQLGLI